MRTEWNAKCSWCYVRSINFSQERKNNNMSFHLISKRFQSKAFTWKLSDTNLTISEWRSTNFLFHHKTWVSNFLLKTNNLMENQTRDQIWKQQIMTWWVCATWLHFNVFWRFFFLSRHSLYCRFNCITCAHGKHIKYVQNTDLQIGCDLAM